MRTLSCMAPWMTPATLGKPCSSQPLSAATSAFSSLTSHARAAARTPELFSSWSSSFAVSLAPPERDRNTRLRAPCFAIQRAILRPRPPRPPLRMYVASDLNLVGAGGCGMTLTTSLSPAVRTTLPMCLPACSKRKASSIWENE